MEKKVKKLIVNAWLIPADGDCYDVKDGFVYIDGNRIIDVGSDKKKEQEYRKMAQEVMDAEGMIVMPGLVNAHTHLFQTFTRGLADDKPLLQWLKEEIWPFSSAMDEEDIYYAALLGCVENIRSGATAVIDQHYIHTSENSSDMVYRAMEETGIRGVLCRTFANYNYTPKLQETDDVIMDSLERLREMYHGKNDERLGLSVGPINPWGCTKDLYRKTYEFAMEHNMKYQIHTAETESVVDRCLEMYGMRNVPFLESLGILGKNTQLAHAIWLDDDELDMVEKSGASVIHCPVANMYLADGTARIPEMMERNIPVALGTDGPGSNNSQDMMEVLKTTSLLHRVHTLDALTMQPETVIHMATSGGARALGRDDLGKLKPGYRADLIFVDWKKAHIGPVHRPASAVVYNANGNDVDTVMVDGDVVMRGGTLPGIDEKELVVECQRRIAKIKERM